MFYIILLDIFHNVYYVIVYTVSYIENLREKHIATLYLKNFQ